MEEGGEDGYVGPAGEGSAGLVFCRSTLGGGGGRGKREEGKREAEGKREKEKEKEGRGTH